MLYDAADEPETLTPRELREAYDTELRAVIEGQGVERTAETTGIPTETVTALEDGESPSLTLSDAASILALDAPNLDADAIVREVRDHLLMGMATGVLDVDTIASNVDLDLSGQEIQQAIEGRTRMSLTELAAIHNYVAGRNAR